MRIARFVSTIGLLIGLSCTAMAAAAVNDNQGDTSSRAAATKPKSANLSSAGSKLVDAPRRQTGPDESAFARVKQAALAGSSEQQYRLSNFYRVGRGTAADHAAAFEWMKRAAEGGLAKAQLGLAYMFWRGDGTTSDVEQARLWLGMASSKGDRRADVLIKEIADASATKLPVKDGEAITSLPLSPKFAIDGAARNGRPALIDAAARGQIAALRHLLDAGVAIDATDAFGSTALHAAAAAGKYAAVAALLAANANPDVQNRAGETALWLAAREEHPDVAEALLRGGADPSIAKGDQTPLVAAIQQCHEPTIERILAAAPAAKSFKDGPHLSLAARSCNARIVARLIEAGARVNARDLNGRTALWQAADRGDSTSIVLLLTNGADVRLADESGLTPLARAITSGQGDAANLLVVGAEVGRATPSGNTPLILAAHYGLPDVVRKLIARRVDIDARNAQGYSALMSAVQERHSDIARLLIDAGASRTIRNKKRQTADDLAHAIEAGRVEQALNAQAPK